ncbi:MAG: polyphosphate:AMP phosphotransferase [Xanthomonadales bacterium]|nr:polyphosphate:AMP phosphotransferase [Xanthomonadales bacterium]NIX12737.1 polyphosphate:AMP phosphotransferase [Xanthomonadales bacterium]
MFNTAELGLKIPKREFKKRELTLRRELLELQQQLRERAESPVLIDFGGVSGAGKGTSTNMLNKWMDASYIETFAYDDPSDEELERPTWWRFWRDLPPRGQIGIYLSGRYSRPILDFVYGNSTREEFNYRLEQVKQFEQALADDGAMIQKFWMHISSAVQKRRLESLQNDPLHNWRMSSQDWTNWEMYDRFIEAAEIAISHTSTGDAPWEIVEGEDLYYRSLRIGEVLRDSLERHLKKAEIRRKYLEELNEQIQDPETESAVTPGDSVQPVSILQALDLTKSLDKRGYRREREELQARLNELHEDAVRKNLSFILVFEGPDAAGKSGAIRQVTEALDARSYKVYPFSAPTDEENAHHYLWRFWRCIPRRGRMTIFDRSWYGRVLVERIEGFASDIEWRRAYAEINQFEEQLVEHGIVLLKFWIHIDEEEQLKRFKAREETPHKRWKLTDEDWRNREKWAEYERAAHRMIQATSKRRTPWVLIEGNDKPYARIRVLTSLCDALEQAVAE